MEDIVKQSRMSIMSCGNEFLSVHFNIFLRLVLAFMTNKFFKDKDSNLVVVDDLSTRTNRRHFSSQTFSFVENNRIPE